MDVNGLIYLHGLAGSALQAVTVERDALKERVAELEAELAEKVEVPVSPPR